MGKIQKGEYIDCHFGPLYIVDRFKEDDHYCVVGLNGRDGVHYTVEESEAEKISRDEFDLLLGNKKFGKEYRYVM